MSALLASADAPAENDETWLALTAVAGVSCRPDVEVAQCIAILASGRPALLSLLKASGVASLGERQRLASALQRATHRESILTAAERNQSELLQVALRLAPQGRLDALGGGGGVTPLMAAVTAGHTECTSTLLRASASVDATRSGGLSALMIAGIKGQADCARLLLDAAASTHLADEDGWTALAYACVHGHEGCVRALLDAKADACHTKANAFNCLMAAAVAGDAACVRHLLLAGANSAAVSARGWNAADYAAAFHGPERPAALGLAESARQAGRQEGEGGGGELVRFYARVDGHTHDESWRERPVRASRGLDAACTTPTYWCGARYSHDTNVLQVMLRAHGVGRVDTPDEPSSLLWLTGQSVDAEMLRRLRPFQRVSKFAGTTATLCVKSSLWRIHERMRRITSARVYGFMPRTFLLPEEAAQMEAYLAECQRDAGGDGGCEQGGPERCHVSSWYILKPAAASCGAGITIHPVTEPLPERARAERAVASAYIHPPYLVEGLKFDLRHYVLVTRWEPLTAYVHASGIVRFATEPYSVHDLGCSRAHVTNYAVNKRSARFSPSTCVTEEGEEGTAGGSGSIWSLAQFRRRLDADVGVERAESVWRAVDDLIAKTLIAAQPQMARTAAEASGGGVAVDCTADGGSHHQCFQLFGFDVMLDADARPWLLEVNGDPGLRTESPIFLQINAPMLADMLNLVGVRFPPLEAEESRYDAIREALAEEERYQQLQTGWRRILPGGEQHNEYAALLADAARGLSLMRGED